MSEVQIILWCVGFSVVLAQPAQTQGNTYAYIVSDIFLSVKILFITSAENESIQWHTSQTKIVSPYREKCSDVENPHGCVTRHQFVCRALGLALVSWPTTLTCTEISTRTDCHEQVDCHNILSKILHVLNPNDFSSGQTLQLYTELSQHVLNGLTNWIIMPCPTGVLV